MFRLNLFLCILLLSATLLYSQAERKTYIYGGDSNYPPYEYLNDEGVPDGFNIAVISAIAEELNFNVKFRLDNWSVIRKELEQTSNIDISDMFYSDMRDSLVDFSIPFTIAYDEIFVRKGVSNINSLDDLKGKSVIVQNMSFVYDKLIDLYPESKLIKVENEPEALILLSNGIGDCAVLSQTVSRNIFKLNEYNNIIRVGAPIFPKEYAFVVKEGNSELLRILNKGLVKLKDTRKLEEIEDKWFGQKEEAFESINSILHYISYLLIVLIIIIGVIFIWNRALQRQVRLKTEKLIDTHKKLIDTLENMDEGFYWLTNDWVFTNVNHQAALLFGGDIESIEGKNIWETFPYLKNHLFTDFKNAVETKKTIRLEFFKEELNQWLEIRGIPSKKGLAVFIKDITHVKDHFRELTIAKEKAEKSDKLKSEFLAQISHEIRTPVNNILNYTGLLIENCSADEPGEKEDSDYIYESISASSKRIMRTIDLLINMSEIQLGSYDTIIKTINLGKEVIEPLLKEYRNNAVKKDIELNYINKTNGTAVKGDLFSITQILSNLIDNSIKYTLKGSVVIEADKNETGKIIITVKDTGIGISKEFLPHIFEPFRQEEQGYTRSFDGNGIGMALVKKYCELNDIDIKVSSIKKEGTIFKLTFNLSNILN
ncbi:MAG: transporter substrate-binding domain-containing protein [Melioribacteraceae bacterium]|nr:transporter substrate-binding domain-containing protein [Melioribacteraceae bacterium]